METHSVKHLFFISIPSTCLCSLCTEEHSRLESSQLHTIGAEIIALHFVALVLDLASVPTLSRRGGSLSRGDEIIRVHESPPHTRQGTRVSCSSRPDFSCSPSSLQPLRLREPLHSILLTMCEDQPRRRLPLHSVLEACRVHREEVAVYPASANLHVRRLAGLVLGTISEVSVDMRFPAQATLASGSC